jgi:hypothetical protein
MTSNQLLSTPAFLQDEIEYLNAVIAEHRKCIAEDEQDLAEKKVALAAAWASPEHDRRKPHDEANVTIWETCCRTIDPSVCITKLPGFLLWVVEQSDFYDPDVKVPLSANSVAQQAWRAAFAILDRRSAVRP